MFWNNRVLHDGEDYWVGEVHYEEDGTPFAFTGPEYAAVGAWGDFIELSNTVHHVVGALDQPVLRVDGDSIIGEMSLSESGKSVSIEPNRQEGVI